ncbi:MAG: HigA family addiction module antitoxin [Paracoccaceae bacterium]
MLNEQIEKPSVQAADAAKVKEWYDRNEILLVDVRETSEFEIEHIPGALLLPLSSFDPEIFPTLPGKKVVLHCAIGKRSAAAGKMLLKEGHQDVIHLTGGIEAWKAAGYATEIQILPPDNAPKEPAKPEYLCPPPGHILRDEYLVPLGISEADLAGFVGISEDAVSALTAGKAIIGVELSLRLARYFCTAADFWVRLQVDHDLERARHALGDDIRKAVTPRCTS